MVRSEYSQCLTAKSVWVAVVAIGALWVFLKMIGFGSGTPASAEILSPGTALTVRLVRPLTSEDMRLGDAFEARLISTEALRGTPAIPAGVHVEGRCVAARAGEGNGRPGYLRLALSGLRDARGHFFPLETTTLSLTGNWGFEPGYGAGQTLLTPRPVPQARTQGPSAVGSNAIEAVVTPEANLTFVLLRSAVIAGQLWPR